MCAVKEGAARKRRKEAKEDGGKAVVDEHAKVDSQPTQPSVASSILPSVGFWERRRRQKLLRKFYDDQNDLLELYEKDDQLLAGKLAPVQHEHHIDDFLNKLLFGLNICLIAANLTASILSGSLAIMSTFIDSTMDLSTGIIMGICLHFMQDDSSFEYPRGRGRLEVLGVILCSIIMGVVNVGMILQSVEAVVSDDIHPDMNLPTLLILLTGMSFKVVLMIVFLKRGTSSTKVLAMDLRNDLMTSSTSIVMAFVGDRYWKYADPLGAILVCGMISMSWFRHALEHIPSMIGVRGERENMSRILRIAMTHDERIQKIDHICVFHIGATAIVELHVVMSEELPLKVTHDISHPLEKKLNQLDFVERAYVHCDYFCDGD